MPLIPRVDALLACDDENIPKVRQLLDEFSHDLPELLNQACVLYESAQHSFGQGIGDHFQDLMQAMNTLGLSDPGKVREVVEKPPPPGQQPVYAAANTGLDRLYSRENRGILVARMGVQYAMAVADLLRMRVTSPLSFLRVQCESIAYCKLMRDTPSIAREWRDAMTEDEEKALYYKYQRHIKAILWPWSLAEMYDRASSWAMHCRFSGVSLGLRVQTTVENNKIHQDIKVLAQEFDPDNPDVFILAVLFLLRGQERIFSRMNEANPEVDDPILLQQKIPAFRARVDAMFQRMARHRPDLVRR